MVFVQGLVKRTAVKLQSLYAEGNGVSVKQEDGSAKEAIISKIEGDNYTVKYADGSEATVAKSSRTEKASEPTQPVSKASQSRGFVTGS